MRLGETDMCTVFFGSVSPLIMPRPVSFKERPLGLVLSSLELSDEEAEEEEEEEEGSGSPPLIMPIVSGRK